MRAFAVSSRLKKSNKSIDRISNSVINLFLPVLLMEKNSEGIFHNMVKKQDLVTMSRAVTMTIAKK